MWDGDTLMLACNLSYDDVTGQFSRVEWNNPSPFDWHVVIESETKPPFDFTMRRGRSGSSTNFASGYTAMPLLISLSRV